MMVAIDKLCGCCGVYQDLRIVGEAWDNELGVVPKYKRFHILNVCESCAIFYKVEGFDLTNSKLVKFDTYIQRIKRASCFFVEPDGRVIFKRNKCYDSQAGKAHQFVYIFEKDEFEGSIHSSDKRKLRRGLRKLGCKGKIERLIK